MRADLTGYWQPFLMAITVVVIFLGIAVLARAYEARLPKPPTVTEQLDILQNSIDSLAVDMRALHEYLKELTKEVEDEIAAANPNAEADRLARLFVAYGLHFRISPRLLTKLARHESNFRVGVMGKTNDSGVFQVRTDIWYEYVRDRCGNWNRGDARAEVCAGVAVLRYYIGKCSGDVRCALSRYNTGRDGKVGRKYASAVMD